MVRNYKRKSERADISKGRIDTAVKLVLVDGLAVRAAAQDVDRMILTRYLKNRKVGYEKCAAVRQGFSEEHEVELANHVKSLDDCLYGLSSDKLMKLAYEYGLLNGTNIPVSWKRETKAGWFKKLS